MRDIIINQLNSGVTPEAIIQQEFINKTQGTIYQGYFPLFLSVLNHDFNAVFESILVFYDIGRIYSKDNVIIKYF